MENFNKKVAAWITSKVGSMWTAYGFALISLVALPAALKSHSAIIIVAWLSQAFLQLILLPIIMVGQGVQSQSSDDRMVKMMMHMSNETDRILNEVTEILKDINGNEKRGSRKASKI
jgi:hypothetical protein